MKSLQRIVTVMLVSTCPSVVLAEDTVSFTFAPPPITSPNESVTKIRTNLTMLEIESGVAGQQSGESSSFMVLGFNFLTKQQGLYLSGGMIAGGDDTSTTSLTGFNFGVGYEGVSESGFGASGGVGMDLIFMETNKNTSTGYFYNETGITTLSFNFAVQQRVELGSGVGLTPYVSMILNMGGSGYSDTTVSSSGYYSYTSTPVEVDPYSTTQIGFDIDIESFSLSALVQQTENTSLTSFNFGLEF